MATQQASLSRAFDLDTAVTRLLCLAANKQSARSYPVDDSADTITASPFRIFTIDDLPEPSEDWKRADEALKLFADEIAATGGVELMVEVYDEAVERHGYRAIAGVSASWDGLHGWWH
jgi:hypothetical protein